MGVEWEQHNKGPGWGSPYPWSSEEADRVGSSRSCRTLNSRPLGFYPEGPRESKKVLCGGGTEFCEFEKASSVAWSRLD